MYSLFKLPFHLHHLWFLCSILHQGQWMEKGIAIEIRIEIVHPVFHCIEYHLSLLAKPPVAAQWSPTKIDRTFQLTDVLLGGG